MKKCIFFTVVALLLFAICGCVSKVGEPLPDIKRGDKHYEVTIHKPTLIGKLLRVKPVKKYKLIETPIQKTKKELGSWGNRLVLLGLIIGALGFVLHLLTKEPPLRKILGLVAVSGGISLAVGLILLAFTSIWTWIGFGLIVCAFWYYMHKHKDKNLLDHIKGGFSWKKKN